MLRERTLHCAKAIFTIKQQWADSVNEIVDIWNSNYFSRYQLPFLWRRKFQCSHWNNNDIYKITLLYNMINLENYPVIWISGSSVSLPDESFKYFFTIAWQRRVFFERISCLKASAILSLLSTETAHFRTLFQAIHPSFPLYNMA